MPKHLNFTRPETEEEYPADIQFSAYAWGLSVFIETKDGEGPHCCAFLFDKEETKTLHEFITRYLGGNHDLPSI